MITGSKSNVMIVNTNAKNISGFSFLGSGEHKSCSYMVLIQDDFRMYAYRSAIQDLR